jgi:hypothetical protein
MSLICPKCGRKVPDDSVYCPYCAHGLKPSAATPQVTAGGILMIVTATSSLILLILSINALAQIYSWIPRLVAQKWFIFGQLLTVISLAAFVSAASAAILTIGRKNYRLTMISAFVCTFSGLATYAVSMIIPDFNPLNSFVYYFLPLFVTPLIGTLLILRRKQEFK